MTYISLTKTTLDKNNNGHDNDDDHNDKKVMTEKQKKIFRHPVRDRILCILRDGKPRTQRNIGKLLSMSNAAVHYHIKLLLEVGIIKLFGTRPGPNGITEKLYAIDTENWPMVSEDDVDYYIDYIVSWMNERHREGLNILKSKRDQMPPFLAGSYTVCVPLPKLIHFKRKVEKLFSDFYDQFQESNHKIAQDTYAFTFAMLPSLEKKSEDSRNILEYEPDSDDF